MNIFILYIKNLKIKENLFHHNLLGHGWSNIKKLMKSWNLYYFQKYGYYQYKYRKKLFIKNKNFNVLTLMTVI